MDSEEQGAGAPGAALLLIIGEPFSEDHKTQILAEITKGFRCWDVEDTGININEELAQIANRASLGEEGTSGDRSIQHQSDNLAVEILINPLSQSVKNALKKLLIASAPVKYVIYAGHAFQDSGAWVLQDDTFSFSSLAQVFKNAEVEAALKQNIEASLTIHTLADSNWGQCISKADFTNSLRIQLNPPEKLENIHGVLQFTAYVGSFVKVVPVTNLLQASEQFGNISFTRPTLYIFPGCQGDSALFGVNGFHLLVDGGYNRRACFWDFARHLDRVDAMLLSHLGTDNIFSINTVLQRKSLENIHPQIGYLYFNAPDKMVQAAIDESGDAPAEKNPSLLVNLSEEAKNLTKMAKQLGISPHPCSRAATSPTVEPINFYHKLGHGSLDMYPLNPVTDGKEMKDFYQHWMKQSPSLGSSGPFPLQNVNSVCTLLVWKPYNNNEKIVRILFPGSAPQHKIAEGLEKVKDFRFLKFASCTGKDLLKPPATKKGSTRPSSGASTARASTRTSTASSRTERSNTSMSASTRKTDMKSSVRGDSRTSAMSPTKSSRPIKDEPRKIMKTKEDRDAKTQPSSSRTKSSATSPTKSSAAKKSPSPKSASPAKSPSPPKTGSPARAPPSSKSSSPPKSPSKSKTPSPEKIIPAAEGKASTTVKTTTLDASTIEEIPAAVPEPIINQTNLDDLKPESDQTGIVQGGSLLNSTEVSPPKEAWTNPSDFPQSLDRPSKDIFSTDDAFSSFNNNQKFGAAYTFGGQTSNGLDGLNHSNADHLEMDEDEIKPQALPDPPSVVIESPSQESDGMPDYSSKIEADEQELSDFSKAEADIRHPESMSQAFKDPAQDIPPSPEPTQEEQTSYSYTSPSSEVPSSFVFKNDEPSSDSSQPSMERNIQYGIDNTRGRAMGGIQEVDEEEPDDNEFGKGVQDEEDERSAFERDDVGDEEIQKSTTSSVPSNEDNDEIIEKQDYQEKDYVEESEEEVRSDYRSSAERQFDDVEDDMTPNGKGSTKGEVHDCDKDVDESQSENINGKMNGTKELFEDMGNHFKQNNFEASTPNAFIGLEGAGENDPKYYPESQPFEADSDDELGNRSGQPFDPVSQWGQPMGLPSPPPLSDSRRGATSPQKSKAADKRPASASTRLSSDSKTSRDRPGTASARSSSSRTGTGTKRPSSSRSSPPTSKVPPLPPLTAFYVDLTYIPYHGDPAYCDIEFFKRVRARYYVLSSLSPNPKVLDCLMEAKATWEDKDLEVTLIPTYDNETLRHWMGLNKEKLQELHMDMTPAVSRCTIQLQDLETSLPAYRLEV